MGVSHCLTCHVNNNVRAYTSFKKDSERKYIKIVHLSQMKPGPGRETPTGPWSLMPRHTTVWPAGGTVAPISRFHTQRFFRLSCIKSYMCVDTFCLNITMNSNVSAFFWISKLSVISSGFQSKVVDCWYEFDVARVNFNAIFNNLYCKTKTIMLINGINILVLEAIYQRDASKYKSKYKAKYRLIYEPVWNMGSTQLSRYDGRWPQHQTRGHQRSSVCKACFGPARASALMKTEICCGSRSEFTRLLLHCTLLVFLYQCS